MGNILDVNFNQYVYNTIFACFGVEEKISSDSESVKNNDDNNKKDVSSNILIDASSTSDIDHDKDIINSFEDQITLLHSSSLLEECSTSVHENVELHNNSNVKENFSFFKEEEELIFNNSESVLNCSDIDDEKEIISFSENLNQLTTYNIDSPTFSSSLLQGCPIVIDFGTSLTRVGFSSKVFPSNIFPTVIGKQKNHSQVMGIFSDSQDYYGNKAISNHVFLNLHYLLRNGEVCNWENMKDFIKYTIFNEMGIKNLENHPILIAEPIVYSKEDRVKLTEFLFEEMGVSMFFLASQASLALLGSERKTGIIVDCGEGVTSIEAIYEGYVVHPMKSINLHLSGCSITNSFINLLQQSSYISPSIWQNHVNFNAVSGKGIAQNLKEFFCNIREQPLNNDQLSICSSMKIKDYILPDDTVLHVDSNIGLECGESLFNPKGLGKKMSIQSLIVDCVERCDSDLRSELYKNVVLCGGSTLIKGFVKRLQTEIQNEMKRRIKSSTSLVNVIALNDRQHLVWKGGAILANSSMFQLMCVTKEEYDYFGSSIINYKCFN